MAVRFKLHEPKDSQTVDLVVRVSAIENGFVIKAGGPPRHVGSSTELRAELDDMLVQFSREMERKRKKG